MGRHEERGEIIKLTPSLNRSSFPPTAIRSTEPFKGRSSQNPVSNVAGHSAVKHVILEKNQLERVIGPLIP